MSSDLLIIRTRLFQKSPATRSVGEPSKTAMNLILSYLQIMVSLTFLPFFVYLAIVTLSALRRGRDSGGPIPRTQFLFVIPAHNEQANIRSTIESCRGVFYDPELYQVLVIADNCTDKTAQLAQASGAEVFERTDSLRRSKGYALECFFDHRPGIVKDFDAIVMVDADTIVDRGILSAFAGALAEGKDWIQCYYSVRNPDSSWRTRMMTYAFSLYNGIWLLGQDRMGLGVGLKGNGMCFSTRGLARFPWEAHGLTEDLEFSWKLRIAGERPHFLPGTRVCGSMPSRGGSAAAAQRCRWEAGRKAQRRQFIRLLLRSRHIGCVTKLMYLIDLIFPPLVTLLLGLLLLALFQIGGMVNPQLFSTSRGFLPMHGLMAVVLVGYTLSPFLALDLPMRYLASLFALPYYTVWKLITTIGRDPTAWIRTPREPMTSKAIG
jgi:1,2-diacylglycerol 3-beta-glucosyltransferase